MKEDYQWKYTLHKTKYLDCFLIELFGNQKLNCSKAYCIKLLLIYIKNNYKPELIRILAIFFCLIPNNSNRDRLLENP